MRELTIILRYDSEFIEAIGKDETAKAASFGWKMSDILSAFTLHAASKTRQSQNRQYILVSENGEIHWDVLHDGEGSLLLSQDSAL
jgi:hypothetical protein